MSFVACFVCEIFKTFNQSLIDLYLINHLNVYRANIAHQKKTIYGLFKEFKILPKFNKHGLYMTPIALQIRLSL